jgi:hypothetical protein
VTRDFLNDVIPSTSVIRHTKDRVLITQRSNSQFRAKDGEAPPTVEKKVVISYSSQDIPLAERLAGDLRANAGIDVWLDKLEIRPGDGIMAGLEERLAKADVFILVLSPESVGSQWVDYERQAWLTSQIEEEKKLRQEARPLARRLITLLYRDCQKPTFLQSTQHVNINDQNYDNGFKQLVSAILNNYAIQPLSKPPLQSSETHVIPRKLALNLLKSLLTGQFEEVVFLYEMPPAYLLANASQVEKAISLIGFAQQKEGEALTELINTIFTVATHLRR